MSKSRKARTDPYLTLLEYRNTPSQGLGTSPVQRLMSRRTRAQLPIIPKLLSLAFQPKIYQKLLAKKEWEVLAYNRGAKDLGALRGGDTVQLVPPEIRVKKLWKQMLKGVLELGPSRWLQRRPAGVQDLLWWLKEALSSRINSRHPYLNKHRLVMSSPRRVSGQPYPVVEWMRPMGMRWHLGNRSHLFSLVGYLCKAQQRDQAELLRSQLI